MVKAMSLSKIYIFKKNNLHGFSYIWFLIFLAILNYGLLLGVETISSNIKREKEKVLLVIGHQFRNAIRSYYEVQIAGKKNEYPSSLEDLLKDPRFPGVKRHLRQVFVDPITGQSDWGLVKINGRIVGIHSLSNLQPIKIDKFDIDDSQFQGKIKYSDWIFIYPSNLIKLEDSANENKSNEQ
jgi:hypothetical protein